MPELYQCTEAEADAAMAAATNERLDIALACVTLDTPEALRNELNLLTRWAQGPVSRGELKQIHERAGALVEKVSHHPVRFAVAS